MTKIFISYRRQDISHAAGRLYTELEKDIPKEQIFMDVDSIPLGVDFIECLKSKISSCSVLLALIGPGWASAKDENGQLRLEKDDDIVRIEIATALERGIPVIPVLIDNTQMPQEAELPEPLKPFALRNAFALSHHQFSSDVRNLVEELNIKDNSRPISHIQKQKLWLPVAVTLIILISVFFTLSFNQFYMKHGYKFKDCTDCPAMIVLKAGSFLMGSNRYKTEMPVHRVKIKSFAAGQYEVTFSEWDACAKAGACQNQPEDFGWGRGSRPVVNVSWQDAQSYVQWLSRKTGKNYRLLTEAEWEYAARAGTTTDYTYGDTIKRSQAQFSDKEWGSAKQTIPIGSLKPNAWKLYDIHGNVWEWVEDCKHEDYKNAPDNGTTRKSLNNKCTEHILRGGSWNNMPKNIRSAKRGWHNATYKSYSLGFRVVRDLD